MKWMIASDLHGSAYYCKKMLEAYDREGAQRLLLLGDILYHGPRNDLPRDYAPKEVIAMLNARKADIYNVRGNCDTEVDQMVLEFPVLTEYMLIPILGAGAPPVISQPTAISITKTTCRLSTKAISFFTVTPMCRSVPTAAIIST